MSQMIFIKYLLPVLPCYHLAQISPKTKSAQILLKFGLIDILNMSILISMLKITFIKYLLSVRPKLVPKLNMLRIYGNLAHLMFQTQTFTTC